MNLWKSSALGAAGTLATVTLERVNIVVALLCGLLTAALLVRKCYLVFRVDWAAWRARRRRDSRSSP